MLGWRQLIREKKRFCTALAGVSFGVILMLFQLGIFQAFMLMAARPIDAMKGELVMISRNFQYFMDAKSFPERRLYQTLALPDVKEVYPVMIDYGSWRHPETGREGDQAVFGVRPHANPFILPRDVEVITRQELILREKTYWEEHTPLGFIVISGMIIAMFVGAVIVYQILYTDINDHVREYATLKAMGLGDGFFLRLVLQEAAILTAFGFIPGVLFTWVLFYLAETEGGLPTRLTIPDTLLVFGLTVVTCVIAGLLATRRLRAADPADSWGASGAPEVQNRRERRRI